MPPPKRCLYGKCTNTSKTNDDESIYFVPFPKLVTARTRNRVEKWLKACGNGSVTVNHIQSHQDKCFVCSSHFVGGDGPTKLNPDPIPYVPDVQPLQVKIGMRCRKVCAVRDCDSVSTRDEQMLFNTFPKHHLQLELWRTILKLENDPPRSRAFVCSKHFISGIKSENPSHPDYLPSIFASSSAAEIKALRLKLREFESGYAKLRLERNCAALRKHWYECGFTRMDLIEGVRRVKSDKRKRAEDEKMEAEAKRRREMEAEAEKRNESGEDKLISEMKEESMSDFEECDEEFIIENDRAGDSEEEFDLSRVKEEPVSDTDIPGKTGDSFEKSSQDSSPTGLRKVGGSQVVMSEHEIKSEPQDDECDEAVSPGMDRVTGDFCDEMLTVHFGNQGTTDKKPESDDNNDTGSAPITLQDVNSQTSTLQNNVSQSFYTHQVESFQGNLHGSGSQLMNPVQNFGFPSNMQNLVSVPQPLYTNFTPDFQGTANSTSQQPNTNQNLAFQNNLYSNQIPLLNLGFQSNMPYNVLGQAVQVMGFQGSGQNVDMPCSIPLSSATNSSNYPAIPVDVVKTVVALDPNTYQSPITAQTTFVVPKENIITLSIDGGKDEKEMVTDVDQDPSQKSFSGDISVSEPNNIIHKHRSRRSSVTSEHSSFNLSCDEASCGSVSSIGYQPSSSASEGSTGPSRPESCDIESDTTGTINEKVSIQEGDASSKDCFKTESVQQSEQNSQERFATERAPSSANHAPEVESTLQDPNRDADSRESSNCEKNSLDENKQNSDSIHSENKSECSASCPVSSELPPTQVLDVSNSKMCQTDESISKEATLKRQLASVAVKVTPDLMKYLLKQKLCPSGVCSAIHRVKKCQVNCSVQAEMDKYVIPDLSDRCIHLASEVKAHKQKLQSMTYDFLNCGASKTTVLCHTGCYTIETLKVLFEYVSICLDTPPVDDLSQFQEFVMTLMKLRLGLHNYDLAFRFEVEPSIVVEILTKWMTVFVNTLSHLIVWPEEEPERTEHRNQRWRLLKLRYDLLQAYDGIDSLKDKWLLQQDLDDMIKICDVLNSFQVDEQKPEIPADPPKILPEPVQYFIEEIVVEDSEDECLVTRHSSSESSTAISSADLAQKEILYRTAEGTPDKDEAFASEFLVTRESSSESSASASHADIGYMEVSDNRTKVPNDVPLTEGKETKEGSLEEGDPSVSECLAMGHSSSESSAVSPAELPDKEVPDYQNKVSTDVPVTQGKKLKDGDSKNDKSTSVGTVVFGEAENEESLEEDAESGTKDSDKEDLVQMLNDTVNTNEKALDSRAKGPDIQGTNDVPEDVEILSNSSVDDDFVLLESQSPDGKSSDYMPKDKKISIVNYVDDADCVVIGAPEIEVEICDYESNPLYFDVSLENSTSIDMSSV